ncbi:unnamed protein product [Adineta steineri]|uniref:TAF6 C-terminal HEAT repeat domain-containing protein n=1 Tax=Adineta steineri TaxID=433720 RepID=A0A816DVH9_9BILA|nr:unnamed protein product [Adineta steineri]CAF1638854.1 unnamed protein product [Adineta steineri]
MLVEVIVGFCLSNGNLLFKTITTGLYHREFQCVNEYELQLNQEQQIYYKEITEVCVGSEEQKRQETIAGLSTGTTLHPILSQIVVFIYEDVKVNLTILISSMRMTSALSKQQIIIS